MLIDLAIGVLLFITIIFLWSLNNKVNHLRDTRTDFIKIVKFFDEALMRSESSINELKAMSNMSAAGLQQTLEKAKYYTEDLAFATDRANSLIEQLNNKLEEARTISLNIQNSEYNNKYNMDKIYNKATENQSSVNNSKKPISTLSNKTQELDKRIAIESLLSRISSFNKANDKERKKVDVR